jgi:hypothetical protein
MGDHERMEGAVATTAPPERWTILSPVAKPPVIETSPEGGPFKLGRSISGLKVGLEIDYAWICYVTLIDEWERLLKADGAEPLTLWVERRRDDPERDPNEVRAEVDEWSKLIDCGVVGLGN